jgi:hypothetical protein
MIASLLITGTALAREDGSKQKFSSIGGNPTVSISGEGTALVRGAEVTSVGAGSIEAKTAFDSATLTWSIDTDGDTSYVGTSGKIISRSDIEVGDTISFSGELDGALSVDADVVRTWNDDAENDSSRITGTIVSVASGSFVLETGNRRVTVDVDNSTDIMLGKEDADLADLSAGQKVTVAGAYDGDEFNASSVTGIALKSNGKGWGVMDIFKNFKLNWNH